MTTQKSKSPSSKKAIQNGNRQLRCMVVVGLAWCIPIGPAVAQQPDQPHTWQPLVTQLVKQYAAVEGRGGTEYLAPLNEAVSRFADGVEKKQIGHKEKLYYYYAWLLNRKYFAYGGGKDEQVRAQSIAWFRKCLDTPYNRPESMASLAGHYTAQDSAEGWRWERQIAREYPLYAHRAIRVGLNNKLHMRALHAYYDAENVPHSLRYQALAMGKWSPMIQLQHATKAGAPLKVGDLYAEMNDFKKAVAAYQNADLATGVVDKSVTINDVHPHPAWEKLASLYEKIGDWDMALHWRLKQLAGTVEDTRTGGRQRTESRRKELTDKIIHLLARIGAAEPTEPLPPPKYDIEKLRTICDLYLEMWYPNLAMEVVAQMEQLAGKELPEDRARVWEKMAASLLKATAAVESSSLFVLIWDQVWTYDKVVAVHKQAIEWGKKAGWEEARLKKLEDQITKLPELLKYVKEPKNFQDLLDGKATEPKW